MAKKKGKKLKVTCTACGSGMARRDVACRKCGQARPGSFRQQGGAAKSVFVPVGRPAFVAKSARPRCGRCNAASRAGARHCTTCGAALLSVVKSAGDLRRDALMSKFRREDNPDFAEALWYQAHPDIDQGSNGGRAS